ncbi:MAG: hypothetical protein WC227_03915 [Patescibacteria group bacterium]|jgi:hypothetical protein
MKDHHKKALTLATEILETFGGSKLSILLQKGALLARLVNDTKNQIWIEKEITGTLNQYVAGDKDNIVANGRYWTVGKEIIYRLDHVEVLENTIDTLKIRLSVANDPNISFQSSSQYSTYVPHSNAFERNTISESIRTSQSILSRIRGRLYCFIADVYNALSFSEAASDIFSEIRDIVEKEMKNKVPEILQELVTAYKSANSDNQPDWSNVASGCRRIIIRIADIIYPPSNETTTTRDGKVIKLDTEHYRLRIKEFMKGKKIEDSVARDTSEYVCELIDSVTRLEAKGDKHSITKEVAQKIIIYTYMLLDEIIERTPNP